MELLKLNFLIFFFVIISLQSMDVCLYRNYDNMLYLKGISGLSCILAFEQMTEGIVWYVKDYNGTLHNFRKDDHLVPGNSCKYVKHLKCGFMLRNQMTTDFNRRLIKGLIFMGIWIATDYGATLLNKFCGD